jgi:beta-glucanase (GH16 family)
VRNAGSFVAIHTLDLAVGGTFPGPPSASTAFPADMKIDWVRVTQ